MKMGDDKKELISLGTGTLPVKSNLGGVDVQVDETKKTMVGLLQDSPQNQVTGEGYKEKMVDSLTFEDDIFHIGSNGWIEGVLPYERYSNDTIDVKVMPETKDVVEYSEGPAKGQQLFIRYESLVREVCKSKHCTEQDVKTKYILTSGECEQMLSKMDRENYLKFYNKLKESGQLCGYWDEAYNRIYNTGNRGYFWLSDGHYVIIWPSGYEIKETINNPLRSFGFSGLLCKVK